MTKLIDFVGQYLRDGKEFLKKDSNIRLLISSRKTKTTITQPETFLLYRTSETEKRDYVSSLYGTTTGGHVYNFDYQGAKYVLKLSDNELNIEYRPKTNKVTY
jgi:hypothetical protein